MPKIVNNLKNRTKISLILMLAIATQVKSDEYLKNQPSFLKSCTLQNVDADEKCFAKGLENVFTNWKDGIPGLKTVGSIDPFRLKKIHLEQSQGNIDFKADLKNVVIKGLSTTNIEKISVSNQYNMKIFIKLAKFNMNSDYRIKGRILLLNLDGTGPLKTESSDLEVVAYVKTKLIERSGRKFFEVQQARCNIKTVGAFHIRFDNLFGGATDLENSANELFNASWRELFEVMRPALEQTLDAIVFDRFKKILNYVPARFFFSDV